METRCIKSESSQASLLDGCRCFAEGWHRFVTSNVLDIQKSEEIWVQVRVRVRVGLVGDARMRFTAAMATTTMNYTFSELASSPHTMV